MSAEFAGVWLQVKLPFSAFVIIPLFVSNLLSFTFFIGLAAPKFAYTCSKFAWHQKLKLAWIPKYISNPKVFDIKWTGMCNQYIEQIHGAG